VAKDNKQMKPKDEAPQQAAAPQDPGSTAMVATSPAGPIMVQEDLGEYGEHMGQGHEERRASDNLIPMIYLLQDNSKVVKDRERPVRANPGDFYNTATDRVYDGRKGLVIVPVLDTVRYVEWVPIDDGGGFVAEYSPDDERIVDIIATHRFEKIKFPAGVSGKHPKPTELIETRMLHAVILHEQEAWEPVVFPLTSIKLGMWKKWFNAVFPPTQAAGRLPQYSQLAHIASWSDAGHKRGPNIPENVRITPVPVKPGAAGAGAESRLGTKDSRFQAGFKFWEAITKGGAKIDREAAIKADGAAGSEEIPFDCAPGF
jgi:hypothetical protein